MNPTLIITDSPPRSSLSTQPLLRSLLPPLLLMSSALIALSLLSPQAVEAAPSLSLTIWGAELSSDPSGHQWDLNSAPDVFIRVSLGGRFLRESEVKRDDLRPTWALTVGPLSERRFSEGALIVQVIDHDLWGEEVIEEFQLATPTRDQLGEMVEKRGQHVRLLYQWGLVQRDISRDLRRGDRPSRDRSGGESPKLGRKLEGRGRAQKSSQGSNQTLDQAQDTERALAHDQARKNREDPNPPTSTQKSRSTLRPSRASTDREGAPLSGVPAELDQASSGRRLIDQARRQSARRAALASRLYQVYLRAQFEGDQLEAHRVLIKLAQHYPYTRHGRKAQRLLLLDGR